MQETDQTGAGPRPGAVPEARGFTLLNAAMASGLCLDLMIERLLDSAGEAGA